MSCAFFSEITDKVMSGIRLSADEGLKLLQSESPEQINAISQLADKVREKKVGNQVLYALTLNINPTNLCELNCPFCSFYAKPGWEKAWFLTPSQIEEKIAAYYPRGLNEIHIVGGLWRDCNLDYYRDVFQKIKKIDPNLHIKALTPVEYDFLAEMHGISVEEVFRRMMEWGLDSMPGGGAEVLVDDIRKKLAPGKISSERYLAIHEIAHNLGLRSNITMLFGSIEENEHLITHLCKVRDLQDKTGGFKTFIPLKFGLENNALGKRKKQLKAKNENLIYAVSRLILDNFQNLKVLWSYVGVEKALELLSCGANDLSSTNIEEKIIAMAGGTQVKMDQQSMVGLIHQVGKTPYLAHSGMC